MAHEQDDGSQQDQENESRRRSRRITVSLEDMDDVEEAVAGAIGRGRDVASSIGSSIRDSIESARSGRRNVVAVRVSDFALERIDALVDSSVVSSRSEAAAFLIEEGVKASDELFTRVDEQLHVIRAAQDRLRDLLGNEEGAGGDDPGRHSREE